MKFIIKQTRINKAIAMSGLVSRRKAEILIKQGKVKVNGQKILDLSTLIAPDDKIEIEGRLIKSLDFKYLLFYKPVGYITTSSDEEGRKIIYDLLPLQYKNLKPAGRLDYYSEGLIILSNDGDFLHALQHPSKNIPKVYTVILNICPDENTVKDIKKKLLKGIPLDGKISTFDEIKETTLKDKQHTSFLIVMHEGKKRQIRRMFQYLGLTVRVLKRISVGGFRLNTLHPGHYKEITRKEAYRILEKCK